MTPKIFIIILNWNRRDDTLECLKSVYALDYRNYEVILVDNGSTDDSVSAIKLLFPQAILIKNRENLGYTGGNNVGMRYALEQGADYFWLLNNDTVVRSDTLSRLVEAGEKEQAVGLLSPSIYYYDEPDNVQFIGAYVDTDNLAVIPVTSAEQLEQVRRAKNLVLYGTAVLIKRAVIEAIGVLPEEYFAYHEDCHFSLKALEHNFQTTVVLDAPILHKESRTTAKLSPVQVFLRCRNIYFLCSDNCHSFRRNIQLASRYISNMLNYAGYLFDEGKEESSNACITGVWSALTGKGGGFNPKTGSPLWFKALFKMCMFWHPGFWTNVFRGNMSAVLHQILVRVHVR